MRRPAFRASFVLAFAVTCMLADTRGEACPNGIVANDATVAGVRQAEKLLDDGNTADALRKVRALLNPARGRRLRGVKVSCEGLSDGDVFAEAQPSATGLTRRAQRILVLGNVRIDDCPAEAREELREQAVNILRERRRANPHGALEQADYAEALETLRPAEAKTLLEDLATRDVLPTAYGWAALARLRAASGDARGRDAAMQFCGQTAKAPSICTRR